MNLRHVSPQFCSRYCSAVFLVLIYYQMKTAWCWDLLSIEGILFKAQWSDGTV